MAHRLQHAVRARGYRSEVAGAVGQREGVVAVHDSLAPRTVHGVPGADVAIHADKIYPGPSPQHLHATADAERGHGVHECVVEQCPLHGVSGGARADVIPPGEDNGRGPYPIEPVVNAGSAPDGVGPQRIGNGDGGGPGQYQHRAEALVEAVALLVPPRGRIDPLTYGDDGYGKHSTICAAQST